MAKKATKVHNFECCCDKPFELDLGAPGAVMATEVLPGTNVEVNRNANGEIISLIFPTGVSKCEALV